MSKRRHRSNRPAGLVSTVVLLAVLLMGARAHAGPWTKDLGKYYLKVDQGFFVANSYVDASGQVIKGTEYLGVTTSFYAEVGIWKKLHLMTYLPYSIARNTFDDGGKFLNFGGGDAIFGVQYSPPIPWKVLTALRMEFKVPMYDVSGIKGPLAAQFPAFGDGQMDVTFILSAGYALQRTPLYFLAEVGYRHRTEVFMGKGDARKFVDGFTWLTQVGYTIKKRVLVSLNFGGVIPFKEDVWTKGYATLGLSLYIPVYKGLGLDTRFDPIIWARNSSMGFGFGFGVSYTK